LLDDGIYEALVVDATDEQGSVLLELTIIAGVHKGEVVSVRAAGLTLDAMATLGLPATLTVRDGQPGVELEP
jgi:hypothetical protein